MSRPSTRSRAVLAASVLGAVVVAYAGGVLTGVAGSREPAPPPSVVDEAADRIADSAAREVDRGMLERAAVEGMLKALGDRWSTYLPAADFAEFTDSLEGRYSGVGLWVRQGFDGVLLVGSVQSGSPAEAAGLQAGDELVAVAGAPVVGRTTAEVVSALRGDPGTTVAVTVRRAGGDEAVTLTRATLAADDVSLEARKGGVSVLRVAAFTRGVGAQVRAALKAADPATYRTGIVLDLRANPGGLLDEAVDVAGAFLDGGPVVSYERRGQPDRTLQSYDAGDTSTGLVVLVDGGTASAAEVVAAALQDRNRAVVVGAQTFGKGSVQEPSRLSDGSALELTVGRYLTPNGRVIDGVGVEPDVVVGATASPRAGERRAIEVLTGLTAALDSATGRG